MLTTRSLIKSFQFPNHLLLQTMVVLKIPKWLFRNRVFQYLCRCHLCTTHNVMSNVFSTPLSTRIQLREYSERFLWKCQKKWFGNVLQNMSSEIFCKFCTKYLSRGLFIIRFSFNICENFKSTFLYRIPPMAASTADLEPRCF